MASITCRPVDGWLATLRATTQPGDLLCWVDRAYRRRNGWSRRAGWRYSSAQPRSRHHITLAYMIADPGDWPSFRRAVHGALVASLYLEPRLAIFTDPDTAPDQELALQVLDEVRDRYHPAVTWAGFVLELWDRRLEFQLAVER